MKVYFFRVEGNLVNGDISIAMNEESAIKCIKENVVMLKDGVYMEDISTFEMFVGRDQLPVPNEIVEVEIPVNVNRRKI